MVTATLSRQCFDKPDALAHRDGRTLRRWMHAVLVEASAKYCATLDCQASQRRGPDIESALAPALPENVPPFVTGQFRRA